MSFALTPFNTISAGILIKALGVIQIVCCKANLITVLCVFKLYTYTCILNTGVARIFAAGCTHTCSFISDFG